MDFSGNFPWIRKDRTERERNKERKLDDGIYFLKKDLSSLAKARQHQDVICSVNHRHLSLIVTQSQESSGLILTAGSLPLNHHYHHSAALIRGRSAVALSRRSSLIWMELGSDRSDV